MNSQVGDHRLRGVVPRRPGDAAARMRARAAQIEARDRHAVVGKAEHRSRREQLIECQCAVENVAAGQAELALRSAGDRICRATTLDLKPGA